MGVCRPVGRRWAFPGPEIGRFRLAQILHVDASRPLIGLGQTTWVRRTNGGSQASDNDVRGYLTDGYERLFFGVKACFRIESSHRR